MFFDSQCITAIQHCNNKNTQRAQTSANATISTESNTEFQSRFLD